MLKKKISMFGLSLAILFSCLFLNGCSPKPFLTQDGTYVILTVSPSGMTQSELVELPWNTNMAVLQKFLLEASFVLSDLHTPSSLETSTETPVKATRIQANFPQPKRMKFVVDNKVLTIDVQSIQIEVEGANVGQVILNQTIILQGIENPNLHPAFQELTDALHKVE
ncbi:hypothetical protein [Desulfosporosinus lacus]|uniref:Sporulation and spore germination n=1 Tax=Desulfosporosinus lacus DSM 15449 TaxID=1121420 RepID=A0A1M5WN13_9FIRM|nr:hypothetical protein [Desulfosporosinus lacus]SHH88878.1 hypothetical protein SAMN02746098_01696 [Desulfosporosinus lacus DSM 15449]